MNEKIQIGVACGHNSDKYVNFLIESIIKTVSDIDSVEFLLAVNKKSVDKEILKKHKNSVNIKVFEVYTDTISSMAHGHCLDFLLEKMNTKLGMFVDSDACFLEKNWDQLFKNQLGGNIAVVGADTDPAHNHYRNFPFTIMCMFRTEIIKKCNISFKPRHAHVTLDEAEAKIFNRQVGDVIHLDTAWQLPFNLKSNGYDGVAFPMASPRHGSKDMHFMQENMRGEEYQFQNQAVFTHLGRGSSRCFDTNEHALLWRSRVKEFLGG